MKKVKIKMELEVFINIDEDANLENVIFDSEAILQLDHADTRVAEVVDVGIVNWEVVDSK